jgi:hypothetical protein
VKAQNMKVIGLGVALVASLASGCGEVARNGRSPVTVVVEMLEVASGAEPSEMGGTLRSDVVTLIDRPDDQGGDYYSTYNDIAEVRMRLLLRDPGIPGVGASPSAMNAVTFNRYRVSYRRADGRNTPGVDVPYPFDSAVTFTVTGDTASGTSFDIVRHTAKSSVIISTIADVTFYGRDQAGNEVMTTASVGIFFGNFADPE